MAFNALRRLRFSECDPSGIAYFPAYLDTMVGVVEDFFQSLGFPWEKLVGEARIGTPTVKLDVTFAAPGFQGDTLSYRVAVAALGRTSLTLDHAVTRDTTPIWAARQTLVATSLDTHRPTEWPPALRAALMDHLEDDHAQDPAA